MKAITFSIVQHNSELYKQTVELRFEILRRPLGLEFTDEQLAAEINDIHLAGYDEYCIICCCLLLTPIDNNIVQMRQVSVAAHEQGKGTGRQLVEYSEVIALQNGFKEMILHARDTAVEFYLKLGYELVGKPFVEVGIPHRQMRKDLFVNLI
ncbi:MAG: GNAT family N-acetyltransferase [Ignavibacteriae bacterium]|nr:GNAT family N-acetyltransferase [Ignavibacteriota bacterium]